MAQTKTHRAWAIAKFIIAFGLIWTIIKKVNFNDLENVSDFSLHWVVFTFLIFIILSVLKALQYYKLIAFSQSYWDILRVVIWQNAISNFIASSAGIASYMTMLKAEQNVKLTRSGITFLITKFGDLLAICVWLGLSAILVWKQIGFLRWLTVLLIAGMLASLGAFLVTVLYRKRFVDWIARTLTWFKLDRFSPVTKGIEMLRSLAEEEQSAILKMLQTGVRLSFVYMTVTMAFSYAGIRIFDVQVGLWPVIYVAAMMQLVSFIPIQVLGGLGVSEVTSVYLYGFFGLAEAEMSAVMLGLRVLFYLMNAAMLLYFPFDTLVRRKSASRIKPS